MLNSLSIMVCSCGITPAKEASRDRSRAAEPPRRSSWLQVAPPSMEMLTARSSSGVEISKSSRIERCDADIRSPMAEGPRLARRAHVRVHDALCPPVMTCRARRVGLVVETAARRDQLGDGGVTGCTRMPRARRGRPRTMRAGRRSHPRRARGSPWDAPMTRTLSSDGPSRRSTGDDEPSRRVNEESGPFPGKRRSRTGRGCRWGAPLKSFSARCAAWMRAASG